MILIAAIEIIRQISPFAGMTIKYILAIYFCGRYLQKKERVPLVWGMGFFFLGLSQVPFMAMRYFQDPTTNAEFALFAAFLAALSLALLYYGTSLLYFIKGSFMREKLSIISFVVMMAVILVFLLTQSREAILKSLFMVVSVVFIFPMLFVVAVIFFMIWRRLEADDPRKTSVFMVGAALLTYSILSGTTSTYFGTPYDWIFIALSILSFVVLLYGMILGRATGH